MLADAARADCWPKANPHIDRNRKLLAVTAVTRGSLVRAELRLRMEPELQSTSASIRSHWHRWFAWRPVFVSSRMGNRRLVWLQYVERRWTEGMTSGLGPRWIYRRSRRSSA